MGPLGPPAHANAGHNQESCFRLLLVLLVQRQGGDGLSHGDK